MKRSVQQLLIVALFSLFQNSEAIVIYNNSNQKIKFNIFRQDTMFEIFSKAHGTLTPHQSFTMESLDPEGKYKIIFYDPYNAQNNYCDAFDGNTDKIAYQNQLADKDETLFM